MKTQNLFFLVFIACLAVSCSANPSQSMEKGGGYSAETSDVGSAVVSVELTGGSALNPSLAGGISPDIIGIDDYTVTNAVITLSNTKGEVYSSVWNYGQSAVFTFTLKRLGAYCLNITSLDTGNNTNISVTNLVIQNQHNYRLRVQLGGTMSVTQNFDSLQINAINFNDFNYIKASGIITTNDPVRGDVLKLQSGTHLEFLNSSMFKLKISESSTIAFWWKDSGYPCFEIPLLSKRVHSTATGDIGLLFVISSTSNYMVHTKLNNWNKFGNPMPPSTNWHFTTLVKNQNIWMVYENGVQLGQSWTNNLDFETYSTNMFFGYDPANATYFDGCIDSINIYNSALDPTDIAALYQSTKK